MKRLLLAAFLLINSACSFGQERENTALPIISDKILWQLDNATGWMKSSDGQWLSVKNKIQAYGLLSTDVTSFNKGENIVGIDNFVSWQARNVTVQGRPFILLTKELKSGRYKYPTLGTGFFTENKTVFLVFKKGNSSYDRGGAAPSIQVPLYYWGIVDTGPNALRDIAAGINEGVVSAPSILNSDGTGMIFVVYTALNKDPANCRFFAMVQSEGLNAGAQLVLPKPSNLFINNEFIQFRQCYFELPYANFSGLLDLIKPTK